jgi:putative toxin-antitoxin system antitoxin component (TIGR02293 family)
MTDPAAGFAEASHGTTEFDGLVNLFGGPNALKRRVSNPIEAHEMILQGIPGQALEKLISHLIVIEANEAFGTALGMSERTFQRHKADRSRTLSTEQSSRAWNFARILTKATSVFGTQEEAEKWMIEPAMGLNRWRPIDLLATAAGSELVEQFLERIDYGVYT